MLFNSIDFALFLPLVFAIYWLVPSSKLHWRNGVIVLASYIFYAWWDWRFLSLILVSTLVDFSIGNNLSRVKRSSRKLLFWASIIINVGILALFKYYDFFAKSFTEAFHFLGLEISIDSLNLVLPVGISFYTFQTMSYTIDVYREKIQPTNNLVSFAAFVCFFPQLVAGPIERAANLLPQFNVGHKFSYAQAKDGLRQILWGLFKKVVIADNCALVVNSIFDNYSDASGSTLVVGAVLFAFQIYGDFSGYSDIAIGTARLFGFKLKQNFAFPYFSRDIAEFWRRWHISLSTWFRDYVYIPLGGSRVKKSRAILNIIIVFLVSGFWHGANWTFIAWGLLNALYFIPLFILDKNRQHLDEVQGSNQLSFIKTLLQILFTFSLTCLAWVFFRSDSIGDAISYLKGIFSYSLFSFPEFNAWYLLILLLLFIVVEWVGRHGLYAIERIERPFSRPVRWCFYYVVIISLYVFGIKDQQFIYFQF
ncbi:MBOAT family O-acyltransferase [Gilvibacter sp.]|uniref:MBOAT family O-acyltransferase n=1 Tax=Gilvibacter sp. TaxID=2729997 RepID=UPI003F4A445F